ncbi:MULTISPECIES: hypothetical protein [Saccharothrix]|uniref:hypothetical protein n=1 Tax=Saccharothrix TaxID=2071 RepID=UPI00095BA3CC|nr:hypothetical protein [Saccharothrix sp. CB00851]OKI36900.1 hypothetical protein A6A25_20615 [Saccharothrix sp. CB00851]
MNQGPAGQPSDVYSRYGLNRHSEVQTGEQVRERVNQELTQQYGPFGVIVGMLQAPGQVDDLLDAQAAKLKGQVETRSAPDEPGVHYLGIPHQQLHESVNSGVDPGAVGEMGEIWTTLGNQLATFNDDIVTAIGNSEADWVGKAGDGARQALADMGNRAGETGTSAQLAGTLFAQQSRALSTAKANVPPPPAEPFNTQAANDRLLTIIDPLAMIRQAAADKAAFEQQQKDHQEAARAVETYDRTVAQTAAAQPAFAPAPVAPPQQPNPETPVHPPGPGDPKARDNTPPPPISGNTDTSWSVPSATTGGNTTNPSGVVGPLPGGGQTGGNTNPAGGGPVLGGGFPLGPNPNATTGRNTTTGPNTGRPGGSPPNGPTGNSSGTGRGGTGGVGRLPGVGVGLPGGGVGLPGGAAAAKGIGGSTGMLPGDGTAARSGVGAPGATGGRGAAGPGGMAPGAGAGAGRGQGDEDIEHQSPSYLLEADPDKVFGTDETTAPPVIGDWSR